MEIKIFKKEKHFKKREHQPNPDAYWKFVFFTGALIVILATGFGVNLFMKINKESELPPVADSGQVKVISRERIMQALEIFSKRESEAMNIILLPSPVSDPSL